MLRRHVIRTMAALLPGGAAIGASNAWYEAEIAKWRKEYDRDLRSEKGPLYLIGRHDIPEGRTAIGSDPAGRIALPERAPKRVGVIERRGDTVTFEPAAGVVVSLKGKPVAGRVALRTGAPPNPSDRLEFGDFGIVVSVLEGTCQLAIRDRQSPYLKLFQG